MSSRRKIKLMIIPVIIVSFLALSFGLTSSHATGPLNELGTPIASASQSVTVRTIATGTYWATPMYIVKSSVAGPVIMVIGGVHGNEPAGYKAADIIRTYTIKKGTLIVIPRANLPADKSFSRTSTGVGDLNRSFPTSSTGRCDDVLASSIWKAIKDYHVQWLIDLHEGYNYNRVDSSSVGQTVIYYPVGDTGTVARSIVTTLNTGISITNHKFNLMIYPVAGGATRAAGQYLGVHTFILETCSQQTLTTRVNQQQTGVKKVLRHLGMQ
ncbi:MAG: succinylglutamate desuccinylase/aspartoacylase family protein [Chitinophagales bacterium]